MPVILHGGDEGELNHHFKGLKETIYIFNMTFEEISKYDMGEGEKVPTLEELLRLVSKKMYINLEVKAPKDPKVRIHYNYKGSITKVH